MKSKEWQRRKMQELPNEPPDVQATLARLYEYNWLNLLWIIRQYGFSAEEAEDVLLDVFVAALESDVFFTLLEKQQVVWLRRTAHNKAVDAYRRSYRKPVVPLYPYGDVLLADEQQAPEQLALHHEDRELLQSHITALPDLQQQVLRLRFVDGLRCKEIAVRLKKNEGTVRSLLSRTLNALRGLYEKDQEGKDHAER
jgi:RNA polymerase sigma factor (sigma-70 family)